MNVTCFWEVFQIRQLLEHGLDLLEHKNVGPPIGKLKYDFLHCKRRGFIALPTGQVGPVYYKGRRYKDNLWIWTDSLRTSAPHLLRKIEGADRMMYAV